MTALERLVKAVQAYVEHPMIVTKVVQKELLAALEEAEAAIK